MKINRFAVFILILPTFSANAETVNLPTRVKQAIKADLALRFVERMASADFVKVSAITIVTSPGPGSYEGSVRYTIPEISQAPECFGFSLQYDRLGEPILATPAKEWACARGTTLSRARPSPVR